MYRGFPLRYVTMANVSMPVLLALQLMVDGGNGVSGPLVPRRVEEELLPENESVIIQC